MFDLLDGRARSGATVEQHGAVSNECLGGVRRYFGKAHGHRFRLKHQAHCMQKQHRVGPGGQAGHGKLLALRVEGRRGFFLLQTPGHQRRVTVDICADLQHRRFAIATGQRGQVRFGHDRRNGHRTPVNALEAQHQTGFFGKQRRGVVVKNQLGHVQPLRTWEADRLTRSTLPAHRLKLMRRHHPHGSVRSGSWPPAPLWRFF
ncbi:methyl-accepting chemotaxis protein [Pseudomonas syringae pv. spinaceae]|uniref:Methyl-accepting chemotaxis protein n=1 Tax=Pseudomonas syringae pv. spinaceae TaxID=264459 RepID=A0A0Q0BPP9_PSESX|nr:methyl-accepting chemotaxis protein [Pseudomonas syringae pv. spinaceae]